MMERGWEKTVPQIEKTDDLQSIANHPVFFRIRLILFNLNIITQRKTKL